MKGTRTPYIRTRTLVAALKVHLAEFSHVSQPIPSLISEMALPLSHFRTLVAPPPPFQLQCLTSFHTITPTFHPKPLNHIHYSLQKLQNQSLCHRNGGTWKLQSSHNGNLRPCPFLICVHLMIVFMEKKNINTCWLDSFAWTFGITTKESQGYQKLADPRSIVPKISHLQVTRNHLSPLFFYII